MIIMATGTTNRRFTAYLGPSPTQFMYKPSIKYATKYTANELCLQ